MVKIFQEAKLGCPVIVAFFQIPALKSLKMSMCINQRKLINRAIKTYLLISTPPSSVDSISQQ